MAERSIAQDDLVTGLIRRIALLLGLAAGLALVAPDVSFASERPSATSCKKKRKKRKKRRARRNRRAKKRVTAKKIKRWQKRGLTNEEIVAKAEAAGYKVTKREARKLRRFKVRKSLRLALAGKTAAPAEAAPAAPMKIDLNHTMDPNDIDFDSVPPPDGTPTKYSKLESPQKEKKKLDTSLRPSAPFVEKAKKADDGPKKKRVVFVARQ